MDKWVVIRWGANSSSSSSKSASLFVWVFIHIFELAFLHHLMSELQVSLQLRNLRIARGKLRLQLRNLGAQRGNLILHLRHLGYALKFSR